MAGANIHIFNFMAMAFDFDCFINVQINWHCCKIFSGVKKKKNNTIQQEQDAILSTLHMTVSFKFKSHSIELNTDENEWEVSAY